MKLSQDTTVVNAIKCILKDYDYLEYNESQSKNESFLHVDVIDRKPDSAYSDKINIVIALEQTTRRYFSSNEVGCGGKNLRTSWCNFRIRERKNYHE